MPASSSITGQACDRFPAHAVPRGLQREARNVSVYDPRSRAKRIPKQAQKGTETTGLENRSINSIAIIDVNTLARTIAISPWRARLMPVHSSAIIATRDESPVSDLRRWLCVWG